ncbi:MAG: acyltransferase family protein [Clostridium sp.]
MKKRLEWIDMCKFIAIFYMVWAHIGVSRNLDIYIHGFHMQIFFFLSGYVCSYKKEEKIIDVMKKKVRSLIVPYLNFAIITYVFWGIFYVIYDKSKFISLEIFLKSILFNAEISPYGGVQWFLTCLFIVEIMYYVIYLRTKESKGKRILIIFFIIILGGFGKYIFDERPVWALDTAFVGLGFYYIGTVFKEYKESKIVKYILNEKILLTIAFGVISYLAIRLNGYTNMRIMSYGNYILFFVASNLAIIFYIRLSKTIIKFKVDNKMYRTIMYLGKNTIIILVLNQVFNIGIKILIGSYINNNKAAISIIGFILTIVVLIAMIPLINLINKKIPIIIGRKKVE